MTPSLLKALLARRSAVEMQCAKELQLAKDALSQAKEEEANLLSSLEKQNMFRPQEGPTTAGALVANWDARKKQSNLKVALQQASEKVLALQQSHQKTLRAFTMAASERQAIETEYQKALMQIAKQLEKRRENERDDTPFDRKHIK